MLRHMDVEWPWARQDAKEALEGLADAEWAARKAGDDSLVPPDYYRDLGNAINVLADITDPPEKFVGKTLRDEGEAALIRAVFDAFEVVVGQVSARGGRLAPDAVFYGAMGWSAVRAAASCALEALRAADT
jgi:hypothetical protein